MEKVLEVLVSVQETRSCTGIVSKLFKRLHEQYWGTLTLPKYFPHVQMYTSTSLHFRGKYCTCSMTSAQEATSYFRDLKKSTLKHKLINALLLAELPNSV